ncbi:3-oxoacyl-ACP reductase, partial [Streptomyces sp. NPDC059744]|uniref:3-oxoacyl-ACP reductase n=1 Tax=Streptomyces sp. NPDC059744 TaxID=3346929 RepID=UPI0036600809
MSQTLPLDGLSVVVTGAGRGLGRAEALELARLGASVVVNDYGQPGRDGYGEASAAPAEEVAEEIRAAGGRAVAHLGDVSDHEQARALVELAVSAYGKLDILVNNAGILRDRMVFSMTEDEWDSVIRVHLKGHFNTTRFAASHWRARSKESGSPVYGRIVNTSSEAFLAGSAGQPNYAAAKGGIVGLTTSTALALAKYGVTANAICPRARTRMTEDVFAGFEKPTDGRLDALAPEHVSPLVGYLASPAAAKVNGQLLVVHGGMVAIVERPRVAATFDSSKSTFSFA